MSEIQIFQILELATVIFETFIVQQYINGFFDRSVKSRHALTGYFLFCIGLSLLSLFCRQPMVLASYTVVGIFIIEFYHYSGNTFVKIFSAFFFGVLMIGLEIVCVGVISTWREINLEATHEYGLKRALYIVIAKVAQIVIVKILGIIVKWKVNSTDKIEIRGAFLLIICQIFLIILSHNVFMTPYHTHEDLTFSVFLSILGIIYINIIVFWYFDRIKSTYEYKHEKELAETKLEFQRRYYDLLEEHKQETEELWHDIKKHMSAIKELYESGLKLETEQYINTLESKIDAAQKLVRTSVPAINVILMDELRKAKKENVEIRLNINILQTFKINAYDLCIILGNTIENAIEACRLLPNEYERIIDVSILQNNSLILIDVKNPFSSTNSVLSQKNGKHGYGLRNVRRVVKQYNGDIEITNLNNIFHVSLIIP